MLSILSIDSLLTGAPAFVNAYMGEALVKGVVNFINGFFVDFINGFFVERGSYICQWVHG